MTSSRDGYIDGGLLTICGVVVVILLIALVCVVGITIEDSDWTHPSHLPDSCKVLKKIDNNTCIIELAGRKYIAVRAYNLFALAPYEDDVESEDPPAKTYDNPFE